MSTTTKVRQVGRLKVEVEPWHPPGRVNPGEVGTPARFDMASARTVVGPGEDCLVCDEPLVAGEVFVFGSWDGRSGPAHEDCPLLLRDLLVDSSEQDNDEDGGREPTARARGGRTP